MEITSVIIKPKITEKSRILRELKDPTMTFIVNGKANKHQVAQCFKAMFGIEPKSVNLLKRKPVPTRYMSKSRHNYTKMTKIAYITVSSDSYQELEKTSELMDALAETKVDETKPEEANVETVEVTEEK